jgi:hypothetical protein
VTLALGLALLAATPGPSWSFTVKPTLATGLVEVRAVFSGAVTARVCLDMPGSGPASRVEQQVDGGWVSRAPSAGDADCFEVTPADPLTLRSTVDLGALTQAHHDADFAQRFEGAWVFNEEAVLLRPDPVPAEGALQLAFDLEPGVAVAGPWSQTDATHFQSSWAQYDAGSYVALGHLESLGELKVGGAVVSLTRLPGEAKADATTLRRWVTRALDSLTDFYGEVPSGPLHRVHVVLAPIPGATDPGVFGEVLRRGTPSVLLLFGAEASPAAQGPDGFDRDWVATHELFHLGNPLVRGVRAPWLVEGFTTYYTDVLRARAGRLPQAEAWASLVGNCRDHGQSVDARSLLDESHQMEQSHSWDRVYRGGACLALRLDVALRARSGGRRTLDDVLRGLRAHVGAFTETELIAALDAEVGGAMASKVLAQKALDPQLTTLLAGLERAPLVAVRRAICAPRQVTEKPR